MKLEKTIRKVEKYIHKELKYLMRETSTLQDLKRDVVHLLELLETANKSKDASVLVEHYEKEAKNKEKYSERIERRLNLWINRIINLIQEEESNFSGDEKEALEKFKDYIKLVKNNLIRILSWEGELHSLIKRSPDWKQINSKVEEALGNDKQPGIRTLMILLEKLELMEENLRKLESRRKFLKVGIAAVAGGALTFIFGSKVLHMIEQWILENNYCELQEFFKKESMPWKNQIKPNVEVSFPDWILKLIKKGDENEHLRKFLLATLIFPLREILSGRRFEDENNSVTPVKFLKRETWADREILKDVEVGSGSSFFSSKSLGITKSGFVGILHGLFMTTYHSLPKKSDQDIEYWFNSKKFTVRSELIVTCKEIDLVIFLIWFYLEFVSNPVGLKFVTSLSVGEEVYIRRNAGSTNLGHGEFSKGKILLKSYFTKDLEARKHVDIALTTIESFKGDSGSPVFNVNGEVVGILVGGVEDKGRFLCSAFVRTEHIFAVLQIVEEHLTKEVARLK